MKTFILLFTVISFFFGGVAYSEPLLEDGRTLLTNARIFDVHTGEMTPPQNIMIEGAKISFVGTIYDAPFDGHIIDCSDKFVLPGLFDCHTHLAQLTISGEDSLQDALKEFVARGITQIRDVGGPIDVLANMSGRIRSGEITGPEMFYTGPMLEKSPLTWGMVNDSLPGFTVPINTTEDVDSVLPSLALQGARLVKTFSKFDSTVYRHLVDVAQQHSLEIVHDPGMPLFNLIPMDKAIDMGVTSIEHAKAPWPVVLKDELRKEHDQLLSDSTDQSERMMFMTKVSGMGTESVSMKRLRQLATKMNENGVFFCPTLNVLTSVEEMAIESSKEAMKVEELPEPMLMMIKKSVAGMTTVSKFFVTEFAKDSVKMFVGQDGIDPSATIAEMRLMNDCGVSEAETIKAATIYPAIWLGVDDRLGSIAPGKQANILIIEANPLEDIGNLESVFLVLQNGRPVSP